MLRLLPNTSLFLHVAYPLRAACFLLFPKRCLLSVSFLFLQILYKFLLVQAKGVNSTDLSRNKKLWEDPAIQNFCMELYILGHT